MRARRFAIVSFVEFFHEILVLFDEDIRIVRRRSIGNSVRF